MTSAFCTECGAALQGGRFCTNCGAVTADDADSTREVPRVTEPLVEDTRLESEGLDADLIPRRSQGAPYTVPPSFASTPVPAKPRRSPWPWVAVGALLAFGAGVGTAIAVWPQNAATSSPSLVVPSISATIGAPSTPSTPVVAPTPVPPSTLDASTARSLVALLNDDLVHHKAFTDAYIDLKNHCGPHAPSLADYDSARLQQDVSTVTHFAALRSSYATRANAIAEGASPTAAALARTFAGLQPDLTAVAKVGVAWSSGVTIGSGSCSAATAAPALTAGDDVNSRRSAWMSRFRSWVPGGDATLGGTYQWFLGNEPKTAI